MRKQITECWYTSRYKQMLVNVAIEENEKKGNPNILIIVQKIFFFNHRNSTTYNRKKKNLRYYEGFHFHLPFFYTYLFFPYVTAILLNNLHPIFTYQYEEHVPNSSSEALRSEHSTAVDSVTSLLLSTEASPQVSPFCVPVRSSVARTEGLCLLVWRPSSYTLLCTAHTFTR